MEVFRITLKRYAEELFASGLEGRWNLKGEKVIYTGASRSLACLENLVHRRGRGGGAPYNTIVISIPDTLAVQRVDLDELPREWNLESAPTICQEIGSEWYQKGKKPLLSVPSAVVPYERNLVINSQHPAFSEIKIIRAEPFYFDPRL